eukprot:jgi/Chlat1/4601/Chrsp290S04345
MGGGVVGGVFVAASTRGSLVVVGRDSLHRGVAAAAERRACGAFPVQARKHQIKRSLLGTEGRFIPSHQFGLSPIKQQTASMSTHRSVVTLPLNASLGNQAVKSALVEVFDSADAVAEGLAKAVSDASIASIAKNGVFTLVLSGGSQIKMLGRLANPPYAVQCDFTKWHVFWADERCVPLTSEDSNYKGAWDMFLSKVSIPREQIYHLKEGVPCDQAATAYHETLLSLVKRGTLAVAESNFPRFDMILLGMGPDGHVASLFPNHPLLKESTAWVKPIFDSPKPPPERITLTLPVLNSASQVVFAAAGAGKAEMVHKVLEEEQAWGSLPAQLVRPMAGSVMWLTDSEAASQLSTAKQQS